MPGAVKKAAGPAALMGAVLLCLPCLLPVLAVLVGAGALTGFGGWITANALLVGLGASATLAAFALLATALIARKRRAAACTPRDRQVAPRADARRKV